MEGDNCYYDFESILSEEEKCPMTFNFTCHGLGYLDLSAADIEIDLEEGAKVELPMWLAVPLLQRNYSTIIYPKFYSNRFRAAVQADPIVLNLRGRTPYFYEYCMKIADFENDEGRFKVVLDKALNACESDTSEFVGRLPELEKRFFIIGAESTKDLNDWRCTSLSRTKTVIEKVLQATKKRKSEELFS